MAVNESRNLAAEKTAGINDGRYKSLTPDRGGDVESSAVAQRVTELPAHYGMHYCGMPEHCGMPRV